MRGMNESTFASQYGGLAKVPRFLFCVRSRSREWPSCSDRLKEIVQPRSEKEADELVAYDVNKPKRERAAGGI